MAAVPSVGRASLLDRQQIAPEALATHGLYERHAAKILGYCLHQLGSREEAEDAVQTTFMNAFRALRKGVVPESEAAWLFKIAENVCLSRRRSSWRRGRIESPADFQVLEEVIPGTNGVRDELIGIEDALAGMPEQQRRAILLREWQGLSYREIAEELDVSQSAVETLIFRARRSLANGLEQPEALRSGKRRGLRRTLHLADAATLLTAVKTFFCTGAAVQATATAVAVTATAGAVAIVTPGPHENPRPAAVPPAVVVPAAAKPPAPASAPAAPKQGEDFAAGSRRAVPAPAAAPERPVAKPPARTPERPAAAARKTAPPASAAARGAAAAPGARAPKQAAERRAVRPAAAKPQRQQPRRSPRPAPAPSVSKPRPAQSRAPASIPAGQAKRDGAAGETGAGTQQSAKRMAPLAVPAPVAPEETEPAPAELEPAPDEGGGKGNGQGRGNSG